jgi:hypothetical protein
MYKKKNERFVIIEIQQISKQLFITCLQVPEEVFIFVNSFTGGNP